MLEMERVLKRYAGAGEQVCAVRDVSLSVHAGELLALHGPSGSGKTTLLELAAAILAPDAGAVRFQGRDLASFSEAQASDYLLRDVGYVHQSPQLMGRVSAVENAAIKLLLAGVSRREAHRRAGEWLERVGLAARAKRAPEQLSGGERQRVAIARALAGDPPLILADEPTGSLDSQRSREIVALLAQIAHERQAAVLLVTHDTDAAALADRSVTLRDGSLVDGVREAALEGGGTPGGGTRGGDAQGGDAQGGGTKGGGTQGGGTQGSDTPGGDTPNGRALEVGDGVA